jgi:hypothetical protein
VALAVAAVALATAVGAGLDRRDAAGASRDRDRAVVTRAGVSWVTNDARPDPESVERYWTKERVAEAEPKPLLTARPRVPGGATRLERGAPGRVPAVSPASARDAIRPAAAARARRPKCVPRAPRKVRPYPLAYAAGPWCGRLKAHAARTSGKLVARWGNNDFFCSATAVNSANKSVVWTAGHCVYDRRLGGFADDVAFIPAFHRGARPFGTWGWRRLLASRRWLATEDYHYDFGAVVVRRDRSGRRLVARVGGQGIGWNLSRRRPYLALGYPEKRVDAFDPGLFPGDALFFCSSPFGRKSRVSSVGAPMTVIGCDMTGGASGGAWLTRFGRGGPVVTSVSSVRRANVPVLQGPYLGAEARRLYRRAARM